MRWLLLLVWISVGTCLVHRSIDSKRTMTLHSKLPTDVGRGEWDDWNGDAYVTDEYMPEDDDDVIVSTSLLSAAMKQSNLYNSTKALQSTYEKKGVHFNIHDEIIDESIDSDVRTDDPPFIPNDNLITEITILTFLHHLVGCHWRQGDLVGCHWRQGNHRSPLLPRA